MTNQREFWNARFAQEDYFYGTEPNVYLKTQIDLLPDSVDLLFLGEGEGRNAAYAARLGHNVTALDASEIGLMKAMSLAESFGCGIRPILLDLHFWSPNESYDGMFCSFLHLTEPLRTRIFTKIVSHLRVGGVFAGEFFSLEQLPKPTGGPKDPELLYTASDLRSILSTLPCEIIELTELDTELHEGKGHSGLASVVRLSLRRI